MAIIPWSTVLDYPMQYLRVRGQKKNQKPVKYPQNLVK
jgi:hypothetical protein